MKNKIKSLLKLGLLSAGLLFPTNVKAQPPLFAGYKGSKYALESRINQDGHITEVGKTFRIEIPIWGYFGASLNEIKKPFYGIGPKIETGRLHTLPTLEGYNGDFTGISVYSTLDLPKGWYLDLVPHLDSNLNYNGTEFTIHRDVKGMTLGVSSGATGRFRELKSPDLQFGKFWKESNVTGSVNLGDRQGKISFQKNFD